MVNVFLTNISDTQVKHICEQLGIIPRFLSDPDCRKEKRLDQVYRAILYYFYKYNEWPTTSEIYRLIRRNCYFGGYKTLQRDLRLLELEGKLERNRTFGGPFGNYIKNEIVNVDLNLKPQMDWS